MELDKQRTNEIINEIEYVDRICKLSVDEQLKEIWEDPKNNVISNIIIERLSNRSDLSESNMKNMVRLTTRKIYILQRLLSVDCSRREFLNSFVNKDMMNKVESTVGQ